MAVDRNRTSVTNGLCKNLKELRIGFQGQRLRMMADYREDVERGYFLLTGKVPTEDAVVNMISYGMREEVLKAAIPSYRRRMMAEALSKLQERHDATKEVEKNLLKLHQVFLEMEMILERQAKKMDDKEYNVSSAAHFDTIYQRSGRKFLCIAILLLLLVLLLLIIIAIATRLTMS